MEELSERYFDEGVGKEKKTISEYTERMKKKEPVFLEDELIKKAESRLKYLEGVQEMYLRLKERNKQGTKNEKLILLQDWFDYTCALRDVNSAFEMLGYDSSENAWDNYDSRAKEPSIKMEEIEKRFKVLLKGG